MTTFVQKKEVSILPKLHVSMWRVPLPSDGKHKSPSAQDSVLNVKA